ncbi:MAG: hypothetical protein JETCAE03_35360 [Ignavibacteriaceae bacterium]|nr:MAG: hypothetical protein JETCAE03_35360 [Ignavibacteriaceae bacterium]
MESVEKRSDYIALKNNIQIAISESKGVSVFSEKELDLAGFYIKKYKELDKEIEKARKSIVDPINKEVKAINNSFKDLSSEFNAELSRLNEEVSDYLREKRRKEEEERAREQKEMEESIISEAEIFNDESVLDSIPTIEIERESLGQMTSTITTARIKKWRVVDLDKIDRRYLIVDEQMISRIRKDYDFEVIQQPINGIEFYYEESIRSK